MKTDQLVSALVADRAASAAPLRRSLAAALGAGAVVTLALFALEFGPRVDLAAAFATWRFDLKIALILLAFIAAFGACVAQARPVRSAAWQRLAGIALAAAVIALAVELAVAPRQSWGARLVGTNALVCLITIPLFAFGPLVGLLLAMRRAAPRSPAVAGAAAGLLAAAAGGLVYAFHCFDDSPLFVLVWYPLAAIPVVGLGAFAGRRLLRW